MTSIDEQIDAAQQNLPTSQRDCFTPRDYQLELLDAALDHNCIVSLGTGFGKTYIAILLIKEYAGLMLQQGMKAFFVVDKIELAKQQNDHLKAHTNLATGLMHGQMNSTLWEDKKMFDEFYSKNIVFVVTHSILNQLLNSGYVKWSDIALLIVDECHHVLGLNHEYRRLMNYYREQKEKSRRPRVLGLTATVINSKASFEKIEDMIENLEILMCSRLETASSAANLAKYGSKPLELIIEYDNSPSPHRLCLEILREAEEEVRDFKFVQYLHENDELFNSIKDCAKKARSALETLGSWACYKICHLYAEQFKKARLTAAGDKSKEILLVYATSVFQQCLAQLEHLSRWQKNQDDLEPYATAQVHRIVEILHCFYGRINKDGKEKPLSAIVFVKERHIAFLLSAYLNRLSTTHDPKYKFIKSDYVIGRQGLTVSNAEDLMVANKRQEQTISKFRNGPLNILISTSVLEEGIDVKSCNCVIRSVPPDDFRAYIQSRGRARAPYSIYCLLCPDRESSALNERLQQFSAIEHLLVSRFTTTNYVIDTQLPLPDPLEPYVVESTGARVTLATAIPLVNRYCAKLPSDVFTRLVAEVRDILVEQEGGQLMYKAEMMLPINAPIKEPIRLEVPVPSRSLARMAVALKACEILHQRKELTDHLLPSGKDSIVQDFLNDVVEDDEYMTGVAGRNIKKRRLYDRKVTRTLTRALAQTGQPCHCYIIDIHLIEPLSEEENLKKRRIIDPHEDVTAFGFICTSELPPITQFPVYLRQGKTDVSFVRAATQQVIDSDTMKLIHEFHSHIFEDILRVAKNAVAFSPEHAPIPLLIVPLIKKLNSQGHVVDAELDRSRLLHNIRRLEPTPTLEQRQQYKFQEEQFRDAVVLPWYRTADHPTYYYVAEICRNDHPFSKFPDEKYESFNEYFTKKYNLDIFDQDQPLLDVDRASERMNLIFPRAPSTRTKKQSFDPTQRQILVPELVHVHPLTATYWTMIIALPTILYRLNQFLLIDELRSTIVQDAFKATSKPLQQIDWPKLEYETPNTNATDKSIRNIAQLRQSQPEQSPPKPALDDSFLDDFSSVDENQPVLEVGYWDPNEGLEFQTLRTDPLELGAQSPVAEKIGEQAALGRTGDEMEMSDGEMEEEYEFITDYGDLRRAIGENTVQPSSQDIVNVFGGPIGWETNDYNAQIEASATSAQNGLISLSGAPGIDLHGLMADLQNNFNNMNQSNGFSNSGHPDTTKKKPDRPAAVDIPSRREATRRGEESFVDEKLIEQPAQDVPLASVSFSDEIQKNTVSATEPLQTTENLDWLVNGEFEVLAPSVEMSFRFQDDASDNEVHGVPPALLLQALTTASASDGINLERLETIGDSFLKLAVTNFLYSEYASQHEGKLSYARSKEVSNTNLFKIGRNKNLPSIMEASKFEPNYSWLPPGYVSTAEFHAQNWLNPDEELEKIRSEAENAGKQKQPETGWEQADQEEEQPLKIENGVETINLAKASKNPELPIPHNSMTQQCINDKAIADAVEALIGAHLISLGLVSTLKFMKWLDIKVLLEPKKPDSPLLQFVDSAEDPNVSKRQLLTFYKGQRFELLEEKIGYKFGNKAFLIQAFTHASYEKGRVTGCYQRLEFLGDAVLDYLVTRFLFEHKGRFAPGILTDLRSALVNNTIFASLAVKHELHKYFLSLSSALAQKIDRFVGLICEKNQEIENDGITDCPNFNTELFMVTEEEVEDGHEEDVEVPKALGDIFESLAGAIFLDSGMNLDVVWRVYYNLMKDTIEECCRNPPLSPVRELFELKGSNARFAKLERIIETNKIRVTVEIDDKLRFEGSGRSFRLAKATAAKRALKYLHSLEAQRRQNALRV